MIGRLQRVTLTPAHFFDGQVPARERKGLFHEGMDADIAVFDPDTIGDRSTIERPFEAKQGKEHLMVNGIAVFSGVNWTQRFFPASQSGIARGTYAVRKWFELDNDETPTLFALYGGALGNVGTESRFVRIRSLFHWRCIVTKAVGHRQTSCMNDSVDCS